MLPHAIGFQPFQTIARRHAEVGKDARLVEQAQFPQRDRAVATTAKQGIIWDDFRKLAEVALPLQRNGLTTRHADSN